MAVIVAGKRQQSLAIRLRQALLGVLLASFPLTRAKAHEIPNTVTARLLARPSGDRFQLLVRVPLRAIRDTEFPAQPSGYLDVEKLAPMLPDLATVWIARSVELYEEGTRLAPPRVVAAQLSLPSDRSFASFALALAHVKESLPANRENLTWEQVFLDVLLEYPIRSERSGFAIRPGLEPLGTQTTTSLEFVTPDGANRPFQFHGDPGRVALDPSWSQAAWRFLRSGFGHILEGGDHLLFLLCLVVPFRQLRALVWIVTAFTLAHSITLSATALGLTPRALWFPALVETLIAATIVFMALENIVARPSEHRRYFLAGAFGLIHGFGFAFAFKESLQFAGPRLFTALFAFNMGVELGQLVIIAVLAQLLNVLFRFIAERKGAIIVSAFAAHSGWHWMTERGTTLARYEVEWSSLMWRCALVLGLLFASAWFVFRLRRRPT